MDLQKLGRTLINDAPVLAGMLSAGPVGIAAGVAKLVTDALDLPASATPEQVQAQLATDPAAAAKIRQLELDHKAHLQELANTARKSELDAAVESSKSARAMAIATGDPWTPRLLAVLVVGGWLFVQFRLLQDVVDPSMRELVARTLGTLDMALGWALQYYFGGMAPTRTPP